VMDGMLNPSVVGVVHRRRADSTPHPGRPRIDWILHPLPSDGRGTSPVPTGEESRSRREREKQRTSCRRFLAPQSLMLNGGLARSFRIGTKSALRSGYKSA
jgi:hypothetical protein